MSIDLETARRMDSQAKMLHPECVPSVTGDGIFPFERGRILIFENRQLRGQLSGTYMGFDPETQGYEFIVPIVAAKDEFGNVTRVEPLRYGVPREIIDSGTVKCMREKFPHIASEIVPDPAIVPKQEPIARILICSKELLTP